MDAARLNQITGQVVAAAFDVHNTYGPGLLERTYVLLLARELRKRGHQVALEVPVRLAEADLSVEVALRLDMLVDGQVVVEVKAVREMARVYFSQLLTYLKLGDYRVGLLINFQVGRIKDGIHRMVWRMPE